MRQAQEEFDRIFPGFRTEPLTLVIRSENGQPVTDQQIAEIRNEAMTVSGFIEPDNDPANMWKERPYLDGASKDPSVRSSRTAWSIATTPREDRPNCDRSHRHADWTYRWAAHPPWNRTASTACSSKLPLMVVLLITTTTILMFLAFGSLVLPIKAALMSALTLGSTMGVLTWMFVDGHFSHLLNFTPQPLMAR